MEHVLTMANLKLKPSLFTPRPTRYAPGPYLKSILLQEHLANILLEQCAFKYGPGAYLTSKILSDYELSRTIRFYGPGPHKSRSKSPKSREREVVARGAGAANLGIHPMVAHSHPHPIVRPTPLFI